MLTLLLALAADPASATPTAAPTTGSPAPAAAPAPAPSAAPDDAPSSRPELPPTDTREATDASLAYEPMEADEPAAAPENPLRAPREPRFEMGARFGYAVPLGTIGGPTALSDDVKSSVPFMLTAGVRISPHVFVGVYGHYGFATMGDGLCPQAAACDVRSYSVGVAAQVHFAPDRRIDPWVSLGAGYEWLHFGLTADTGESASVEYSGFDVLNPEVGVDLRVDEHVALGPFVGLTLGQFVSGTLTQIDGSTQSSSIERTAFHEWLTLGVRGVYGL